MNQERLEMLLTTIDKMRATTIRQLRKVHELGGYRNAAKIVNDLKPYINEYMESEKIIYLSKDGRDLIGSENEVKYSPYIRHALLTNEAYIYFNCPYDWATEVILEQEEKMKGLTFNLGNTALKSKKKVISDAVFTRNGYVHLVEIDNTRGMLDNKKKIEQYADMWKEIKTIFKLQPILYFFTTSEIRKRKLHEWINKKGLRFEVKTFEEIK